MSEVDTTRQRMQSLKAQFSRVWISERDFDEVICVLELLRGQTSLDMQRALLVSAVIAYGRPFSTNETGSANESIASIPVSLGKVLAAGAQLSLHGKVIALRNEAVAHSDYNRRAAQWSFGQGNAYMTWSKPFDIRVEIETPDDLKELALTLKQWCAYKLRDLNSRLIECQQQLGDFQALEP